MVHTANCYRTEIRSNMRGGSGEVKIEHLFEPGSEMLGQARMLSRVTLKPGSSIGFHCHENEEETFHIISDTAEADDNGTKVVLHAGDSILTGNGAGHAIANCGSDDLVLLAVIVKF